MESRGLGDDIKSLMDRARKAYKPVDKIITKMEEDGCGCKERQDKLNKLLPYNK